MQRLLLLHGAIGAADQLQDLKEELSDTYEVHTLNFAGHAGTAMPAEPFSIPLFAEQVHRYIEDQQLQQVNIFGYSMGGYVAMYLAKMYPQSVHKVITLATKFHWDEETAAKEMRQADPEKIAAKVPAFAEALQKRHAPNDWKELLQRTGSMLEALGKSNTLQPVDYNSIEASCLVLLGDRDKMITLEETLNVYWSLPKAEMGILPNTAHPIEQANKTMLSSMIRYFLQ